MTFQRKDIYIDATTANGVDHAVLIGNAATPFALKIALQGLWLAKSSERMQLNIFQQFGNALHDFYITRLLPVVTVFLGFLQQDYFHRSSMAMGWKLPSAMSFSPWRTMSSSSANDITSASLACFCRAIRLRERTAFFIRLSSLDMVWRASKSSALSCICTVVISILIKFAAKVGKNIETTK